ncbi:DUF6624 domain-containing protein [Streptomyces sp. CB02115]|uniref:DUF6624 domain-containing protein n=1 Tax=Streptomyces sp. CB02115 TaxID=1703939 RepID=UPI00093B7AD1|nr:DUF6624 domain-containing protein [Streptomyces sp. CB02115]
MTSFRPDLAINLFARADAARPAWSARLSYEERVKQVVLPGRWDVDRENTEFLRAAMEEHGWPGHRLVGEGGAHAAYLIALHADHDVDFQWLASNALGEASAMRDARSEDWAHMYDRCHVNSGKLQIYGTQYRYGLNGPELLPASLDDIDWRREFVGLRPIAEARAAVLHRHSPDRPPGDGLEEEPGPRGRLLWVLRPHAHARAPPERSRKSSAPQQVRRAPTPLRGRIRRSPSDRKGC